MLRFCCCLGFGCIYDGSRLLDQKFGDAHISEKHCNFFVNKGNASFKDMKRLIDFVSNNVFKKTGIKLEKEIKILE